MMPPSGTASADFRKKSRKLHKRKGNRPSPLLGRSGQQQSIAWPLISLSCCSRSKASPHRKKAKSSVQPLAPLPGKHEATVAMVLGIVSCALLVFGYTALGSVVTGIIGLIYSARAKSLGFNGTPRTVGYVCSLIGLILGALVCLLLVWLGAWSVGVFITLIERCL